MSSSPLTGEVRVPLRVGRVPEVDVRVDDALDRCGASTPPLAACERHSTNSRSAPSTQSGTAGPPNDTEPAGCGWLRRPNQSGPTTSSAPESAPASASHTRCADDLADRCRARRLDADRERVDSVVRRGVRSPGQLRWPHCARLRPPAVVASTTVTTRTGPLGRGWSSRTPPAPTRRRSPICSVTPACSSSTRCQPRPTRLRRALPASATTTASIGPARVRGRRELLGRGGERRRRGPRWSALHDAPGRRARRVNVAARVRYVGDDRRSAPRRRRDRRPGRRRRTRCPGAGCRRRCSPAWPRPARAPLAPKRLEHREQRRRRRWCARPRAGAAGRPTRPPRRWRT